MKMLKKTIFNVFIVSIFCINNVYAGFSDIKVIDIIAEKEVYDEVTKEDINQEVYLALKNNLPEVTINSNADAQETFIYIELQIAKNRTKNLYPYFFNISITRSVYDPVTKRIGGIEYFRDGEIGYASNQNIEKSILNKINVVIKNFAYEWYQDQDKKKEQKKK